MRAPEQRIKLIPWGCEYAEGFAYKKKYVNSGVVKEYIQRPITEELKYILRPNKVGDMSIISFAKDLIYYPLFLDRVIQGINKIKGGMFIMQDCEGLAVYEYGKNTYSGRQFYISEYGSIDQARESALIWVMEEMER